MNIDIFRKLFTFTLLKPTQSLTEDSNRVQGSPPWTHYSSPEIHDSLTASLNCQTGGIKRQMSKTRHDTERRCERTLARHKTRDANTAIQGQKCLRYLYYGKENKTRDSYSLFLPHSVCMCVSVCACVYSSYGRDTRKREVGNKGVAGNSGVWIWFEAKGKIKYFRFLKALGAGTENRNEREGKEKGHVEKNEFLLLYLHLKRLVGFPVCIFS